MQRPVHCLRFLVALAVAPACAADPVDPAFRASAEIRTPKPGPAPRINAVPIFGVRPGNPFVYRIPATGERPMTFAAEGLPSGLELDAVSGRISGRVSAPGTHLVTLRASNRHGAASKRFKVVAGEAIGLTPAMGWNSWNHYHSRVSAEIVLANARAMAASGLSDHGWTYVNIDDAWQGERGGEFHAIQGNQKFPDLKALADAVHDLGLKLGIYSTPWVQSYAGYIGGSAENPEGRFERHPGPKKTNQKVLPWAPGRYSFASNDAKQWAKWGVDYLKYDWNPIELPEVKEMHDALRASGRDIIYSLSNNARPGTLIDRIAEIRPYANSWRIMNDIKSNWRAVTAQALGMEKWRSFSTPGHFNDPDMLEVGTREQGQPGLTPDEEYAHMTWWCLLSAPLLLGNDLTKLDSFTLNVLTNDEVIAISQDERAEQAVPVMNRDHVMIYAKQLVDGSVAVGLFNLGDAKASVTVRWSDLKIKGARQVRDLWRQKDHGRFSESFSLPVAAHSGELVKLTR